MGKPIEVHPGTRFAMLEIISEEAKYLQPSGQSQRAFLCKCDCGRACTVRLSHLRSNRVRSCGCLHGERHEESGSRLYKIWRGMIDRCRKTHSQSHLYQKRGVRVAEEWKRSFTAFKKWALSNGYSEYLTIDRENNDRGYMPSNCRWVTQKVNNCNRRNTIMVAYKGESIALALLLPKLGKSEKYNAVWRRIKLGWPAEKAIDTPIRIGKYHTGKRNDR